MVNSVQPVIYTEDSEDATSNITVSGVGSGYKGQ